jgi:hypothetical protein
VNSRLPEPLLQCADKLGRTSTLAKGVDWYLRKNVERAALSRGEGKACVAWGVGVLRRGIAAVLQEE